MTTKDHHCEFCGSAWAENGSKTPVFAPFAPKRAVFGLKMQIFVCNRPACRAIATQRGYEHRKDLMPKR